MKLALALSLCLLASNADADCAFVGLTATPVTPQSTALPADGGIVIAAVPDPRGKLEPGDAAEKHRFSIKGINKLLARSLAPGLIVIPTPAKAGDLLDPAGQKVLSFKLAADKQAALAVPVVKSVEYDGGQLRRHRSEHVFVTIDNVPANALAIVLADPKGKAKSFGLVAGKPGKLSGYDSGDCQSLPNGTVPSKTGDEVTVMIVDSLGRISPASKPIKIVEAKP